jgi:hypothetical protein
MTHIELLLAVGTSPSSIWILTAKARYLIAAFQIYQTDIPPPADHADTSLKLWLAWELLTTSEQVQSCLSRYNLWTHGTHPYYEFSRDLHDKVIYSTVLSTLLGLRLSLKPTSYLSTAYLNLSNPLVCSAFSIASL